MSELERGERRNALDYLAQALAREAELTSDLRIAAVDKHAELTRLLRDEDVEPTSAGATPQAGPAQEQRPVRPAPAKAGAPRAPSPAANESPSRVLLWSSVGLAAAGAVSSVVFGALALSQQRSLDERCPTKRDCSWGTEAEARRLDQLALAADISLAVAALAGGVAIFSAVTITSSGQARPNATVAWRGSF